MEPSEDPNTCSTEATQDIRTTDKILHHSAGSNSADIFPYFYPKTETDPVPETLSLEQQKMTTCRHRVILRVKYRQKLHTCSSNTFIFSTIAYFKRAQTSIFFYVLLTVHLSIILVINQINAEILVL